MLLTSPTSAVDGFLRQDGSPGVRKLVIDKHAVISE